MKVQAKFKVLKVDHYPTDNPENSYAQVFMMPVINDSPENASWSKYTPSGQIQMAITNPDAIDQFEIGKDYLITFEQA